MVFFESVHRIGESLSDMQEVFGDREAFVGRELTKQFEQCRRARLSELIEAIENGDIATKGEFVVLVAGAAAEATDTVAASADAMLAALCDVMPGRQAVDIVSELTGAKPNDVYKKMLALKNSVPTNESQDE